MKLLDTPGELRHALDAAGLIPSRLEPWAAWKVFKAFCRREVQDVYDCPAVQFDLDPVLPEEPQLAHLYLVRQFSDWEITSEGNWRDASLGRLVIDFVYVPENLKLKHPVELWSMDFPTLEEFASVVEGTPQFQEAMARDPLETVIYFDSDED